jgi:magnesium chelatase family protein
MRFIRVTATTYVGHMYSYASVTSCTLVGVEPRPVRIEATVSHAKKDSFTIVGLPDTAVRESRERVRAAVKQQGFYFPKGRVVVNLSPADLPKNGVTFDLPIALSVLAASSERPINFDGFVAVGELSLHGEVRPVSAGLGASLVAEQQGKACMVASTSTIPATDDARIVGISTLRHAVEVATGGADADAVASPRTRDGRLVADLASVRGNTEARRALEVAASGGHHLLMVGPPGAGKTMLAGCLPGILPSLTEEQVREVSLIHAAAGSGRKVSDVAPFRSPHHSASIAALVGGGSGIPTPGEVSLAHHGALFLDELGEFNPSVLDALRQPIEQGEIVVARQAATVRFPSRVQVIAASNPCPCGFDGDHRTPCRCTDTRKDKYKARLSGPLLDRFDMRLAIVRLAPDALMEPRGEDSASVQARVLAARARQNERGTLNRDLSRDQLDELACTQAASDALMVLAREPTMTARGWDRIRKVARTLSDLDTTDVVDIQHISEAATLRGEWK